MGSIGWNWVHFKRDFTKWGQHLNPEFTSFFFHSSMKEGVILDHWIVFSEIELIKYNYIHPLDRFNGLLAKIFSVIRTFIWSNHLQYTRVLVFYQKLAENRMEIHLETIKREMKKFRHPVFSDSHPSNEKPWSALLNLVHIVHKHNASPRLQHTQCINKTWSYSSHSALSTVLDQARGPGFDFRPARQVWKLLTILQSLFRTCWDWDEL